MTDLRGTGGKIMRIGVLLLRINAMVTESPLAMIRSTVAVFVEPDGST
jgi:hypothetical protein